MFLKSTFNEWLALVRSVNKSKIVHISESLPNLFTVVFYSCYNTGKLDYLLQCSSIKDQFLTLRV